MAGASSRDLEMSNLTALSPLDGRYWGKVKELASSMSEFGLIYFRVLVEVFASEIKHFCYSQMKVYDLID